MARKVGTNTIEACWLSWRKVKVGIMFLSTASAIQMCRPCIILFYVVLLLSWDGLVQDLKQTTWCRILIKLRTPHFDCIWVMTCNYYTEWTSLLLTYRIPLVRYHFAPPYIGPKPDVLTSSTQKVPTILGAWNSLKQKNGTNQTRSEVDGRPDTPINDLNYFKTNAHLLLLLLLCVLCLYINIYI